MNTTRVLIGSNLARLPELFAQSVQTCVTSPPYYGLRSYLDADNEDKAQEIGLEETPAQYVQNLVDVFAQVHRVLKDDGTLWLNLGDCYSSGSRFSPNAPSTATSKSGKQGLKGAVINRPKSLAENKPKNLMMIPHRVSIALQDWGWYVRSDIVWSKINPMPESVTDRPTRAHEYIFLLTKSEKYYYDLEATKEPRISKKNTCVRNSRANVDRVPIKSLKQDALGKGTYTGFNERWQSNETELRQARDVWEIATSPYPEAHFAVFPEELPKRCILAGSRPGDAVLDPFAGSGTTLAVAHRLGRDGIGIELNAEFEPLIIKRVLAETGNLFHDEIK